MKKIGILLLTSVVVLAKDVSGLRLVEGTGQLQRRIELAKKEGADRRNPYHFEKARTNRDVANMLSSNMDDAGAKVFIMRGYSSLSRALSGRPELDKLSFIEENKKPIRMENLGIDIKSLTLSLKQVREDRALYCAPEELARVEVYYEAVAYELEKAKPEINHLVFFYNRAQEELVKVIERLDIAKEGQLECYTGKPFTLEMARVNQTQPTRAPEPTEATKAPPSEKPPESQGEGTARQEQQTVQEEPLMVVARVHFDLNRHEIKKEYIPLLREVVKTLKENPDIRVRVEGFTDDTGSKAYNDKLALKRAQAVKEFLVKSGIPSERIEVAGFGKEKYIQENKTPMDRFTNRRAEFIIIQVPHQ